VQQAPAAFADVAEELVLWALRAEVDPAVARSRVEQAIELLGRGVVEHERLRLR
jgi:hypothetical protein